MDRNSNITFRVATAFICLLLALAIYMAAYYAMLASGPATFHLLAATSKAQSQLTACLTTNFAGQSNQSSVRPAHGLTSDSTHRWDVKADLVINHDRCQIVQLEAGTVAWMLVLSVVVAYPLSVGPAFWLAPPLISGYSI